MVRLFVNKRKFLRINYCHVLAYSYIVKRSRKFLIIYHVTYFSIYTFSGVQKNFSSSNMSTSEQAYKVAKEEYDKVMKKLDRLDGLRRGNIQEDWKGEEAELEKE